MIERGGTNEERLYLYDLEFIHGDDYVLIRKTDMPNLSQIIARHKARYMLPAFFCRPGMRVLDFPCGSGYGFEIMGPSGILYNGFDYDSATINYCRQIYYQYPSARFYLEDMECPTLNKDTYDVIACIEGLEHINEQAQKTLLRELHIGLKPGGTLIISTPEISAENARDKLNPMSKVNPYHKNELTLDQFKYMLKHIFYDVQILSHLDTLHNGQVTNCLYGICRKEISEQPKGDEDETNK